MTIAPELLRRIVEGALLAAGQPLSEDRLLSLIDEGERPEKAELKEVLQQIADSCAERGFELKQVASGWRYQVPEDLAPWINRLWEEKPQKYSRATLETLAIIAYRQPITRGDIEEIRGVAVSSHIVKSLSERGWIKVVGQRDVPGKPSLYATTREFLDYFNLRTLDDLPTLAEIRDIDSLNQALDLDQQVGAAPEQAQGDEADVESASAEPAPAEESVDAEAVQLEAGETEVEVEAAVDVEDAAVAEDSAGEAAEGLVEEPHPAASDEEWEAEVEADIAVAEDEPTEDEAVDEPELAAEAADGDGMSSASLSAELPPSSLFADGDDVPGSGAETHGAEVAPTEKADSGDADTDGETRQEAQVENTTL
ncbi:SMC-Scp complex subunit ScpB [Microbulbifer taiwanensis]|uniref:SMC-Scp complex subunit ScpB n=1 Tax=Microbulbifer taiwanensis TaxID=986746 RepID=A0ABW1YIH7_9GAMM|nr:SMC-Scp complex subunit ScpB [Microbulbifer taiwanensis]